MKGHPKLDPKTGRFLPLGNGEKSPKMLAREKELGVKFESDYKRQYLTGILGQKRFSRRWEVGNKSLIFGRNHRGGRRSWVQMLNLPIRDDSKIINTPTEVVSSFICEICGTSDVPLDNAHWVENANKGATKTQNILRLCPNCHRKLDRADEITTENARETLLLRVVKRVLDSRHDEKNLKRELLEQVKPIVLHRR